MRSKIVDLDAELFDLVKIRQPGRAEEKERVAGRILKYLSFKLERAGMSLQQKKRVLFVTERIKIERNFRAVDMENLSEGRP
ncbi:MAG TPA: hypothetical protein PLQ88_16340 [Blastocatellia bacterium]|nr:hypothetical protein [Blastocatellia bacterium]